MERAHTWNLLDERASWFYEAVGGGPAMAPKCPGPSSAYLSAYKDKAGKCHIASGPKKGQFTKCP